MTPPSPTAQSTPTLHTPLRHFGVASVVAVLVSNMVGTGVFSALGFQAQTLHTGAALLLLWVVGGLTALCGALAYAELGTMYPECGGEYVYLSRAWHPMIGFLGGWVSMTVGFAAPIAIAGIAFGRYLSAIVAVPPLAASLLALGVVAVVHLTELRFAKRVQVALTAAQLLLIVTYIVAAMLYGHPEPISMRVSDAAWSEIFSAPFALSLVFTSYAFTGWNAAGYIAGEITEPERTIPRALLAGTALVTVLFAGLNWSFLHTVPLSVLAGRVDIGTLSATAMFGHAGAIVMSGLIALVLVATISALVLGGSRVTQAVMADLPRATFLGKRGADGVPRGAIVGQLVLIVVLILTDSFEAVMLCAGLTLNLMSLLTVLGMVRLRARHPELRRTYRTWGYPLTPMIYTALSAWTLITILGERPKESLVGLGTVALGAVLWLVAHRQVRGVVVVPETAVAATEAERMP